MYPLLGSATSGWRWSQAMMRDSRLWAAVDVFLPLYADFSGFVKWISIILEFGPWNDGLPGATH